MQLFDSSRRLFQSGLGALRGPPRETGPWGSGPHSPVHTYPSGVGVMLRVRCQPGPALVSPWFPSATARPSSKHSGPTAAQLSGSGQLPHLPELPFPSLSIRWKEWFLQVSLGRLISTYVPTYNVRKGPGLWKLRVCSFSSSLPLSSPSLTGFQKR